MFVETEVTHAINDFIFSAFLLLQGDQPIPQYIEELFDLARDNPLIAVGALVVVLLLTSFLPSRRTTRRTRTYGGRPISYHLGRALGDIFRGRSRRG